MRVDIERVISSKNNNLLQNIKTKKIFVGAFVAIAIMVFVISLFNKPEDESVEIQTVESVIIDTIPEKINIVKLPTIQEIYSEAMQLLSFKDSVDMYEQGKEKLRILAEDSLFDRAKMTYYMLLINSNNPNEVKKGYYGLENIALSDTLNKQAMYECGLTLSKNNKF